jgi:hypothetical protein
MDAQRRADLDPAALARDREQSRLTNNQRYNSDPNFRQRLRLHDWLRRHLPTRDLTWRTHDAELNTEKVTHSCSGKHCGFDKKVKLWMRRKDSDPALYDCFRCFTSEWNPDKVLPIGYEHVVFGSGEKMEPRYVPTDAAEKEASRDANPPHNVGHTVSLFDTSDGTKQAWESKR